MGEGGGRVRLLGPEGQIWVFFNEPSLRYLKICLKGAYVCISDMMFALWTFQNMGLVLWRLIQIPSSLAKNKITSLFMIL